jgi:putative sugar O-methyltransferase
LTASDVIQVDDNPELLDLMLADSASAPEYAATARWDDYSNRFVEFLRGQGLRDFRRLRLDKEDPGRVLRAFGASDLNPDPLDPEELYHVAVSAFQGEVARPISELVPSKVGNPEGFYIDGRFYTASWLNYFLRYAYASKFVRFESQVIVEVGPGSGKQAEMLKKAHPNLSLLLFDLPTQLYVCNQYLSKVFEGSDVVVPYEEARKFRTFNEIPRGKIVILPHWKFSLVEGETFDLLWNAASFQEMDQATAAGYLKKARGAGAMYLMHNIKRRPGIPPPGNRGVINRKFLPEHIEVDRVQARHVQPNLNTLYFDSFWQRPVVVKSEPAVAEVAAPTPSQPRLRSKTLRLLGLGK